MEIQSKKQLIVVRNPYDNRAYNLTPLFSKLKEVDYNFEELAESVEDATELIPYTLMDDDRFGIDKMQVANVMQALNWIKKIFRKIKAIEE